MLQRVKYTINPVGKEKRREERASQAVSCAVVPNWLFIASWTSVCHFPFSHSLWGERHFHFPLLPLTILAAPLLELDRTQPTSTQLFDKQKQGQQAGLWRGFCRAITEGLNNGAQLAEGSSHLEGHQAQARVRQLINENEEEKDAKTNRGFWNGAHFVASLANIQLYTCTCTHSKGFASNICLSKFGILLRPWRKLLTNPGRREIMTRVRRIVFCPEIRTFHAHFFSLSLFSCVQLTGTKRGNSIRENKISKHSKLRESENSGKTIYCYLQTHWKYKRLPRNLPTYMHVYVPILSCGKCSGKGNSFQWDGQREELSYF